jgi:hypothetical protein
MPNASRRSELTAVIRDFVEDLCSATELFSKHYRFDVSAITANELE